MELKINQGFKYHGDDWWKWWVWIEGADNALDQIDHVVYTLHHTFPKPVRVVKDRASKFRLEASGWGVFRIYANVKQKDGSEIHLEHDLQLLYTDGKPTTN
jgi:transcription initiation factor IIF auxiliary subunit